MQNAYKIGMQDARTTEDTQVPAVIGVLTALGGAAIYVIDDSMLLQVPAIALVGVGVLLFVLAMVARHHA